jgi:hypothetical protein
MKIKVYERKNKVGLSTVWSNAMKEAVALGSSLQMSERGKT